MVRRHAVVLTLALVAPALAACTGGPDITSTRADLDAAVAVWTDGWVAPTSTTVAGPALGSNGQVSRVVARRTTSYDKSVELAAQSELHWAKSHGWLRTSSTCGDTVQVALVSRDGDALAQLVVTPDGDGAEAAVQVVTRHHLDATWPTPDPIDRTCLDTTSPPFEPPPLQTAPLGDDDPADDATAEWDGSAADPALADEVEADDAIAALDLDVAGPRLASGVNRRQAPAADGTTTDRTLGDLAARLTGWTLTYAACGGSGATIGTFERDLPSGPAVLRASLDADGAALRLTLPVTGMPDPGWLGDPVALENGVCLGDTSTLPRTSDGVPAVLPTDLTPIVE